MVIKVFFLRRKRFINTGFLNLPICPVYGVIGAAYCIFLTELKEEVFFLFLGGAVVAFLLIVVTGVILEKVFNRKWWDYSQARFQFQGYLNFVHLLFFGGRKIPELMKGLGKGVKSFKEGMTEVEKELNTPVSGTKSETSSGKAETEPAKSEETDRK